MTNGIGFDTGIPVASLTYNHSEAANLQFSWGSNTLFDPYQSYTGSRRMTRGASAVTDQSFGGADNGGKLRSSRQNIALYGRPAPKFFYGIAISGDAGDEEGVDGDSLTARVAFDVMPSLTVGAMAISGSCVAKGDPAASCEYDRDYSRTAIDLQSEVAGFIFNAVVLSATDDTDAITPTEVQNDAFYVQALYTVKDGARTTWAPLLRYDSYDKSGGAEEVDEITVSVNYYFNENVRGMLEFWDRDSSNDTNDDDRLTLQLYAAF